jgi:hypothetical protein
MCTNRGQRHEERDEKSIKHSEEFGSIIEHRRDAFDLVGPL